MQTTQPGKLIVICGIDGSGKSTQERHVANFLAGHGLKYRITKQPTDWYRNLSLVRTFLDTGQLQCSQETLGLLAAADRMLHIEMEIEPYLADGIYIISNRYVYSTYAVFMARGANMEFINAINSRVRKPDLGILLLIDPYESIRRVMKRDEERRKFEERDPVFLGQVQDELIRRWPSDFLIVDGMNSEECIRLEINSYLERYI